MTGGNYHRQTLNQDVIDVTLQTTIGEGRGAGPISIGGGVSYRTEDVFQDAFGLDEDPRRMQDLGVFSSFNNPADMIPIRGIPTFSYGRSIFFTGNPNSQGPIQGEYDVWEVFGESIIPLSSGIDLHVATRYADYQGSGGVWAAKGGLDWEITDTLRFRGTWSRDTRAGTLSERFDTQGAGTAITPGDDPLNPTRGLHCRVRDRRQPQHCTGGVGYDDRRARLAAELGRKLEPVGRPVRYHDHRCHRPARP